MIEQQVVRLVVVESQRVSSDEPAPEGAETSRDQRLQFGGEIDRGHGPARFGQRFGVMSQATSGNQRLPTTSFHAERRVLHQSRYQLRMRTTEVPRRSTKGIANRPVASGELSPSAHSISVERQADGE